MPASLVSVPDAEETGPLITRTEVGPPIIAKDKRQGKTVFTLQENGLVLLGVGVYQYCNLPRTFTKSKKFFSPNYLSMFWKPDNLLPGQGPLTAPESLYQDNYLLLSKLVCAPCCKFDLRSNTLPYGTFLSVTQGPGTLVFRNDEMQLFNLRVYAK